jgi:predicted Rossmann fold nucleotide-binding protein DprA/Smf involved in DNA uptake
MEKYLSGELSIIEIRSGGQTGTDRAALDLALSAGLEIGGFVPKGRLAEDGVVPGKYSNLVETATADPAERTRLNVAASDATLILTHGELSRGSKFTRDCAEGLGRPVFHLDLDREKTSDALPKVKEWLALNKVRVLNVAGPRASEDPKIYSAAYSFLEELFAGK